MWFDWSAPQAGGSSSPFSAGWPVSTWSASTWSASDWPTNAWSASAWKPELWPTPFWPAPAWPSATWPTPTWPASSWPASVWPVSVFSPSPSSTETVTAPPTAASISLLFAETTEKSLEAAAPTSIVDHVAQQLPIARSAFDGWLYSLDRLSATDRTTLRRVFAPGAGANSVIAVREKALRVYDTLDDLVGTNDALARVAVVVPPGVGAQGAAAFAREVAIAVGEPVLTVAPSYDAADCFAELLGMASMSAGRRDGADELRPEAKTLLALLDGRVANVKLVIGHGAGAFIGAELLDSIAAGAARGEGGGDAPRRLISFGAAPNTPHGCDAYAIVGAADPYGWLFVEPEAWVFEAPFATGHHFNRLMPGHIELRRHLADIEREAPFLTAPSRPRPMRGAPIAAIVSD